LSQQNDSLGLHLDFCWTLKPNADHFAFFDRGIPVVMMNTGLHDNYHRPSDTADRVDNAGVMRVARLAFGVAYELAQRPAPAPPFRPTARHETPETERSILARASKPSDRLGVGWVDDPKATQGARLSWIAPGSPAEQAGLRVGDCILRFADRQILSDDDFYAAVSAAESPATLVIKRTGEDKPLEVTVELSGAPLRWGISWRVDDAEPETIILTHVAPGSPAAVAGLQPGDRIYQVAGRDFADEAAFAQRVKTSAETMPLLVERDGRLRVIVLQRFGSHVLKRAA
jgi:S1-C subfamily serine protease